MVSIMADKIKFKFDYMSGYKVLSEDYCDPPVWATYGSDDEPEFIVERGYEIKHNNHIFKVWEWTFINMKVWRVEQYDPTCPYKNKWSYKGDFESLTLASARVKELAE